MISTTQTSNCSETQSEPRNYVELQVNNQPAIYDKQISVSQAVQSLTPSTSDSIDNQFTSNRNIDQVLKILVILISIEDLFILLLTANVSTTAHKCL